MDTATLTALKNAHAKLMAVAEQDPSCEIVAKDLEPVIARVAIQSEEDRILNDMYLAAGNLNKLSIPPEKHAAMRTIVEGMKNALAMVEVPQGQNHVWGRAACAVFRLEDRFKEATSTETPT